MSEEAHCSGSFGINLASHGLNLILHKIFFPFAWSRNSQIYWQNIEFKQ